MAQPQPQREKDSTRVDPQHYSVELENDRFRIIRARYGPGEKSVMHSHPDCIAVFLNDCTVRMTYPDGKSEQMEVRAGQTDYHGAVEHLPENLTGDSFEVILIELKK